MRRAVLFLVLATAILLPAIVSSGWPAPQGPIDTQDRAITPADRTEVIDGVLKRLNDSYVFPEIAKKMEAAVRARVAQKEYESVLSGRTLASMLTSHLQEVSRDKHLRVQFNFEVLPQGQGGNPELARLQARFNNYGFARAERLPGNVGYLDLRGFAGDPAAREVAVAAMNFLAGTSALIIDLRQNGGGSPQMVAFLSSYLFGVEKVHLNDLYWRAADRTDSFYTEPDVPGRRFGPDKPVYVLTSSRTFSAAEEFTYNLQSLKRATIVGETTRGGAHPGGPQRINDHFAVWVPTGRAINPITKTNWEGTGVAPEIALPAPQALATAQVMALKKILETNKDEPLARNVREALAQAERELEQIKKP